MGQLRGVRRKSVKYLRGHRSVFGGQSMKCLDCGFDEGTLLKEFQENPEKSYSWFDLSQMTEVCASCGSENLEDSQ